MSHLKGVCTEKDLLLSWLSRSVTFTSSFLNFYIFDVERCYHKLKILFELYNIVLEFTIFRSRTLMEKRASNSKLAETIAGEVKARLGMPLS